MYFAAKITSKWNTRVFELIIHYKIAIKTDNYPSLIDDWSNAASLEVLMQMQITDDMHRHDKSSRITKFFHVHYNAAHKPIISKSIDLNSETGQVKMPSIWVWYHSLH